MSTDKRSTHTDALETLGTILQGREARDAIHLAVEPAKAGETLHPGDHVGLKDGYAYKSSNFSNVKSLGIVDPFLMEKVGLGERFWLVVYPRQITSLRHVWEHPDFTSDIETPAPVSIEKSPTFLASIKWLSDYAASDDIDLTYHELMQGAKNYIDYDDYMIDGGKWEGTSVPDEFWDHYEIVTGEKVPAEKRRWGFFSCSC